MPFQRIPGTSKFRSPSGRIYTEKQVRAYYATEGFKRPTRKVQRRRPS